MAPPVLSTFTFSLPLSFWRFAKFHYPNSNYPQIQLKGYVLYMGARRNGQGEALPPLKML